MFCCLDFAEKPVHCCFSPCPQSSHFKSSTCHLWKHHLSQLECGAGDCCLCGMFCVQRSIQKQKKEHATTSFHLLKVGNVRMWLKTWSITHTYTGKVYLWLRPNQSSLPAWALTSCFKAAVEKKMKSTGIDRKTFLGEVKTMYLSGLSHL